MEISKYFLLKSNFLFANDPVSSESPFVQFHISCFFKISFMAKEIYFKDTIPTATTKKYFEETLWSKKEDGESGLSERIRAKYRI